MLLTLWHILIKSIKISLSGVFPSSCLYRGCLSAPKIVLSDPSTM